MTQPKLLLIGCNGFLGADLSRSLQNDFTVITSSRSSGLPLDLADAASFGAVDDFLRRERPKYLVITAAITDVEACARDPLGTRAVNVEGTARLLDRSAMSGTTPIFFSSDYALEPVTSLQLLKEEATLSPRTEYGRQKLEIENLIRERFPRHLIFRTSKQMSIVPHRKSILSQLIEPIRSGSDIRPFHDQWMTPVFIEDIGRVIAHPELEKLSGTYHLATKTVFTRYELATLIRDRFFPASGSQIVAQSMSEIKTLEARPQYNTLDSSKISAALGFEFREVEEVLARILNSA